MPMQVKAPGSGCRRYRTTIGIIERAALASGVEVQIVEGQAAQEIHRLGVRLTPAVDPAHRTAGTGTSPFAGHDGLRLKPTPSTIEVPMYGFTTTLTGSTFEQALTKTIAALKAEGFGVLSDIDVQHAMKEKLGVDMPPYRILGACNPPLAYQAVQAVPDIGLLLPCNVIVREEAPQRVVVGFLDPQIMVNLVSNPGIRTVADAAEQRLRRVCESLAGDTAQVT